MTAIPTTGVRFRIEIIDHGSFWGARVFDHEDHGAAMSYAEVTSASLDEVLRQAAHYVRVAA